MSQVAERTLDLLHPALTGQNAEDLLQGGVAHSLLVTHDVLSLVGRQEVDISIRCSHHVLKGDLK